jgi:hypothetical protein
MKQNKAFNRQEFSNYYYPIIKSYSHSFKDLIRPIDELNDFIFKSSDNKTIEDLISFANEATDSYTSSLLFRALGVREILHCRENNEELDIYNVWNLISKSIRTIPIEFTISSIGSQGFLSIPLYKSDSTLDTFDFIRLHIWDDSLDKHMDLKKCEDFSVHSHSFFAKSWIITGKVKNDRYKFKTDSENSSHSFFEIEYNNSLNEVNQHSSKAVNKKINAELFKVGEEVHFENGYYEIKPSQLHKSGHLNSPFASATFFSFTGKDGLGESFVIGPKNIKVSEVNRKMNISPIYLLDKIDSQL